MCIIIRQNKTKKKKQQHGWAWSNMTNCSFYMIPSWISWKDMKKHKFKYLKNFKKTYFKSKVLCIEKVSGINLFTCFKYFVESFHVFVADSCVESPKKEIQEKMVRHSVALQIIQDGNIAFVWNTKFNHNFKVTVSTFFHQNYLKPFQQLSGCSLCCCKAQEPLTCLPGCSGRPGGNGELPEAGKCLQWLHKLEDTQQHSQPLWKPHLHLWMLSGDCIPQGVGLADSFYCCSLKDLPFELQTSSCSVHPHLGLDQWADLLTSFWSRNLTREFTD